MWVVMFEVKTNSHAEKTHKQKPAQHLTTHTLTHTHKYTHTHIHTRIVYHSLYKYR